jgi:hypothetical protein
MNKEKRFVLLCSSGRKIHTAGVLARAPLLPDVSWRVRWHHNGVRGGDGFARKEVRNRSVQAYSYNSLFSEGRRGGK